MSLAGFNRARRQAEAKKKSEVAIEEKADDEPTEVKKVSKKKISKKG